MILKVHSSLQWKSWHQKKKRQTLSKHTIAYYLTLPNYICNIGIIISEEKNEIEKGYFTKMSPNEWVSCDPIQNGISPKPISDPLHISFPMLPSQREIRICGKGECTPLGMRRILTRTLTRENSQGNPAHKTTNKSYKSKSRSRWLNPSEAMQILTVLW